MNLVKAKTTKRFGGEPYITLPRGVKVGSTASESNVFKSITYGFKQMPKDISAPTDLVSVEEFKKDAQVKFYSKDEENANFPYEFNVYGYNYNNYQGNKVFNSIIELPDHNDLNLMGMVTCTSGNVITIGVISASSEEGLPPAQNTRPNILYSFNGTLSDGEITDTNENIVGTMQNPFTLGIYEDGPQVYDLFCEFVTIGISSGTIFPEDPGPKEPELQ